MLFSFGSATFLYSANEAQEYMSEFKNEVNHERHNNHQIPLLATGLAYASITVAHADHRYQRYTEHYDSHKHHDHDDSSHNRKHNTPRKHRHAHKRAAISLEHRYLHKKGIPHRNHLGRDHPHKRWRKQHKRWRYARLQRKYERYSYYNERRYNRDHYHDPYRFHYRW